MPAWAQLLSLLLQRARSPVSAAFCIHFGNSITDYGFAESVITPQVACHECTFTIDWQPQAVNLDQFILPQQMCRHNQGKSNPDSECSQEEVVFSVWRYGLEVQVQWLWS